MDFCARFSYRLNNCSVSSNIFAISAITVKVVIALNFSAADEGEVTTEKNNDRATMTNPFFCIFHAIKGFIEVSNI